ncbi:unnamed protein product, partial [Mesorhabditis spiculigera]
PQCLLTARPHRPAVHLEAGNVENTRTRSTLIVLLPNAGRLAEMARENVEDVVDAEGKPTVVKLSRFRWRDVYTLVQIPSTSPDQAVKMEENDTVRPKAQVWRAPKRLTAVLEEKDIPR